MDTKIKPNTTLKLAESTQKLLRCPVYMSNLEVISNQLECRNTQCKTCFPVIDNVPILLNESSSVFSISDFLDSEKLP